NQKIQIQLGEKIVESLYDVCIKRIERAAFRHQTQIIIGLDVEKLQNCLHQLLVLARRNDNGRYAPSCLERPNDRSHFDCFRPRTYDQAYAHTLPPCALRPSKCPKAQVLAACSKVMVVDAALGSPPVGQPSTPRHGSTITAAE